MTVEPDPCDMGGDSELKGGVVTFRFGGKAYSWGVREDLPDFNYVRLEQETMEYSKDWKHLNHAHGPSFYPGLDIVSFERCSRDDAVALGATINEIPKGNEWGEWWKWSRKDYP